MRRAHALHIHEHFATIFMLETLFELWLLGYPASVLRAAAHAIPAFPAARVARQTVRQWLRGMASRKHRDQPRAPADAPHGADGTPVTPGPYSSGRWQGRQYDGAAWSGGRSTKKYPRRRKNSTSSSSSASSDKKQRKKKEKKEKKAKEKTEKAWAHLLETNKDFAAWAKKHEASAREEDLRAQGEAMAKVLRPSFDDAVSNIAAALMLPGGGAAGTAQTAANRQALPPPVFPPPMPGQHATHYASANVPALLAAARAGDAQAITTIQSRVTQGVLTPAVYGQLAEPGAQSGIAAAERSGVGAPEVDNAASAPVALLRLLQAELGHVVELKDLHTKEAVEMHLQGIAKQPSHKSRSLNLKIKELYKRANATPPRNLEARIKGVWKLLD